MCKEYLNAIRIIENVLKSREPFESEIQGINKIQSVIWLDIKENTELRNIKNT